MQRFSGKWKDLGTWNTLTEAMEELVIGKAVLDGTNESVHIVNELNVPIICMGMKDAVISASPEGILVSNKERSSYIKPYVDKINQQVMFAEKSWGSYHVMDVEHESLTVKIVLQAGNRMAYHSHNRRDEIWNIVSGEGAVCIDGVEQTVRAGDVVTMRAGCRHSIAAVTDLIAVEIQIGKEISVYDKQVF